MRASKSQKVDEITKVSRLVFDIDNLPPIQIIISPKYK